MTARADRLARSDLTKVGDELRLGRVGAGLSLSEVGRTCGISRSQVARIERAQVEIVQVHHLVRIGAAVGLDVRLRAYPRGDPIRDAAQVRLIDRFRNRIDPELAVRTEVPLPIEGDLRAWDAWVDGFQDPAPDQVGMPVEAETRIADLQATTRRLTLKMRDGNVRSVVLVVADTRTNRATVRAAAAAIHELFPVVPRVAWAALASGRHPGGSALLLV